MKRFRLKIDSEPNLQNKKGACIPTRVSLPLARGQVSDVRKLNVVDGQGSPVLTQATSLKHWPDGSLHWCLLEFSRETGEHFVEIGETPTMAPASDAEPQVDINLPFLEIRHSALNVALRGKLRLRHDGQVFEGIVKDTENKARGPIRFTQEYRLEFQSVDAKSPLIGSLMVNTFGNSAVVSMELVVSNPQAMEHPGGNWDLGAKGAILIDDLSFEFNLPSEATETSIRGWLGSNEPELTANHRMHVFQASSGGENWNSQNHIDSSGQVPLRFRGYKVAADDRQHQGERCNPVLSLIGDDFVCSVGCKDFWQNFPRVVEAGQKSIRVGLFPQESKYVHELQGGEQKTHEFVLEFHKKDEPSVVQEYLQSSIATLQLDQYSDAQAWPQLTPRNQTCHSAYEALVELAVEGDDTFQAKAEKIDQYGWRNFGDIYGDHEAVFHRGLTPMISHYNNQYDCVLGFAIQFMRTGDRRWWDMMIHMADHAWDIDTYHTDQDKLLYNHGLFWHTYHYADAHTSTHRSYPKRLRQHQSFEGGQDLADLGETGQKLAKTYAIGGGPAAAHNYNTGWMVAYWLTGCERYRNAAVNAANYVLEIDDGRKTPFKWLSRSDTGFSTCSSEGYYGPGRAAANSTHALITGHELTGDSRYLDRVAVLMRRTVHPDEDLKALDLLNAELRWFYTMYLQALGRYVDYKDRLGQHDADFSYGVASLLHYAHWMEKHERPTLSEPEKLQYPTETWAAQDMRKWHILEHAATYEHNAEKRELLRKKADYFFEYVVNALADFETRSLCRPVILMLNFGWQRQWFLQHREEFKLMKTTENVFPKRVPFMPQRVIAIRRFKRLVFCVALLTILAVLLMVSMFLMHYSS